MPGIRRVATGGEVGSVASGGSHVLKPGQKPRERGGTILRDATAPAVVAAVPAWRTDAATRRFTAGSRMSPMRFAIAMGCG